MKITHKDNPNLRFEDLKVLDVFRFENGHRYAHRTHDCLYLGTKAVELDGDWKSVNRESATFVNLKTGQTVYTGKQASAFRVKVLDAELVLS